MTEHECTEPNCVICQWVGERIMRFNDEMKNAILASAEDLTVEYRRLGRDHV